MAILNNLIVTGNARVQGKIKGDLEGSATTITSVLPIEKGGTGANTPDGAKTNLGITALEGAVGSHTTNISNIQENISSITGTLANNETRISTLEAGLGDLESRFDDSLATQIEALETKHGEDIDRVDSDLATHATNTTVHITAEERADWNSKAPGTHPDVSATNTVLGHVKLSDSTTSDSAVSAGIAATPKAIKSVQDALDAEIKTRGDLAEVVTNHITSSASTYATIANLNAHVGSSQSTGNKSTPGHVKLSDDTGSDSGVDGGIAATPKAIKTVRDALTTEENARIELGNGLAEHIANDVCHMYTGDGVLINSTVPINADTVGGWTKDEILAAATGSSAATGTVGFTTGAVTNPESVILTNVSTGKHLLPKTTVANITDATTQLMRFSKGTTEPAKEIGVIWFQGSAAPYTIKIWNGSAWEVMNSWQ